MELKINFLNNQVSNSNETTNWHSRWKEYKSDWMDEDMKNATVSHYVDRIIINDAQLTSKNDVDDMVEFLTNARESFKSDPVSTTPLCLDLKDMETAARTLENGILFGSLPSMLAKDEEKKLCLLLYKWKKKFKTHEKNKRNMLQRD